jgi:hypothetical protein
MLIDAGERFRYYSSKRCLISGPGHEFQNYVPLFLRIFCLQVTYSNILCSVIWGRRAEPTNESNKFRHLIPHRQNKRKVSVAKLKASFDSDMYYAITVSCLEGLFVVVDSHKFSYQYSKPVTNFLENLCYYSVMQKTQLIKDFRDWNAWAVDFILIAGEAQGSLSWPGHLYRHRSHGYEIALQGITARFWFRFLSQ